MRTRTSAAALLLLATSLSGVALAPPGAASDGPKPAARAATPATSVVGQATARRAGVPRLRVRTVARRLDLPWDVQRAPGGGVLVTERERARVSLVRKGRRTTVANLRSLVQVTGEIGLMSMALDASSRTLWACHGARTRAGMEVRVTRWRANRSWTRLRMPRTVLGGIPLTMGKHGGCRLLVDRRDGALLVGTGDTGVSGVPRDLDSLGGKVLRLDGRTGEPMPDNPWAGAATARRYVLTYGHRNVQGLAQRADGSLWSVEHGTDRDDEVNLLVPGGDYGWQPGPGYDESAPMTDHSLPGVQIDARWSSGRPTVATSGAAWVRGKQWGRLDGTLAVAALKGSRVLFMRFDADGELRQVRAPKELRRYGRLRSVTSLPGGDLLVTTSNGAGRDRVLRVSPRG
ncbi:PQQ-dependent sugar dehydrogenase [Nocardioides campestrisoli]|uniref:PQQ-dependent sugar dehydrogenase n=1 Tax=Nocardioides campestrisoli TaxID=2736757 RepID=UPI0015E79B19|nr:PQQ-dependent sugar dehydrogenase [Nocardioides campestrisoli]